MTIFYCCLYLLLMVVLGYFLFSIIHPGSVTLVQLCGLVPALGAGTLGWLLFWLSLAGFVPSRPLLGVICGLTLAGLLTLAKFGRHARISKVLLPEEIAGWSILAWLMIAAVIFLVAAGNLSLPLVDWDGFAIWGFKAKVLAHEALNPTPDYFHDLTLSYSHLDYPLMLPFLTAGAYAAMGTMDDQVGKLISVFLDVLVVPLVFLGLRWKLSRLPASCLCLVLVLLPAFLRYAGVGCADLPLATFYAGSIIFLARWVELQTREDLILAIVFSSFVAFTKNEGLVLALINSMVLLLFAASRRQIRIWKGACWFCMGWLAIEAGWLLWNHNLPHTHENYGSKLMSVRLFAILPQLWHVVGEMLLRITAISSWGWLWIAAVMLAGLGWRAFFQSSVQVLWGALCLQLLAYALVYCVTPWNLNLLLATTLDRLLWHAAPAVILLAGWHWAEIERKALPNAGRHLA